MAGAVAGAVGVTVAGCCQTNTVLAASHQSFPKRIFEPNCVKVVQGYSPGSMQLEGPNQWPSVLVDSSPLCSKLCSRLFVVDHCVYS